MASFRCCFGCEKRTVGCHASCPDYIEAKKENDEDIMKRRVEQSKNSDLDAYEKNRSHSLKKRHSRNNK